MTSRTLGREILAFLDKHGGVTGDYDPGFDQEADKWSSPDASMLYQAGKRLLAGEKPEPVYSSWGSGGYFPYMDSVARVKHDELLRRIKAVR